MSISFTLSREQVERLLAGFDSINMGLDVVRSALSESANSKPPKNRIELGVPNINSIRWKVKGGADASPTDTWAFVFAKNIDGSIPSDLTPIISYLGSHSGRLVVNGFEVSLFKDSKFINRKKI
jgi:hypothetical protein